MRAERPGRHVEMTKGKGILGGGGDRKHEKDIKDTQNLEQKCHIDPNDRSHGGGVRHDFRRHGMSFS